MLCFIKGDRIIIEMNALTCFRAEFITCRERISLGTGGGLIFLFKKMMAMSVELGLLWRKNSILDLLENKLI